MSTLYWDLGMSAIEAIAAVCDTIDQLAQDIICIHEIGVGLLPVTTKTRSAASVRVPLLFKRGHLRRIFRRDHIVMSGGSTPVTLGHRLINFIQIWVAASLMSAR